MLPTDSGPTTVHPQRSNRLVQYRLYKTQYDLALARHSGNQPLAYFLLLHLAQTYRAYRLLPQAIAALEQAIDIVRFNGDRLQEGQLLYILAESCQDNRQPDPALVHYRRALGIAEELHDPHLKAACLDALRRTKTYVMLEAMQRRSDDLLPPAVTVPAVSDPLWHSVVIALALFFFGFLLLPIMLSNAGVSDAVIALDVIAASLVSLAVFRRSR